MNDELGMVNDEQPVFRASTAVQERITFLLQKNKTTKLTASEKRELDEYEEADDYFSYLNRIIANPTVFLSSYQDILPKA